MNKKCLPYNDAYEFVCFDIVIIEIVFDREQFAKFFTVIKLFIY